MKLKIPKKVNERVFRPAVPVKESLDDKLRAYVRYAEQKEGVQLKKTEIMEKMITQFLDEDKQFKRWLDDNEDVLAEVQAERKEELEDKSVKKSRKKPKVESKSVPEPDTKGAQVGVSEEKETDSHEAENVARFEDRKKVEESDDKEFQKSDAPMRPNNAVM